MKFQRSIKNDLCLICENCKEPGALGPYVLEQDDDYLLHVALVTDDNKNLRSRIP